MPNPGFYHLLPCTNRFSDSLGRTSHQTRHHRVGLGQPVRAQNQPSEGKTVQQVSHEGSSLALEAPSEPLDPRLDGDLAIQAFQRKHPPSPILASNLRN